MREIKVLRPSGTYQCSKPLIIFSIDGEALLQLNQAPGLLINKVKNEMLESVKQKSSDVRNIMEAAAEYFFYSELDGQTPGEYVNTLHRLSGLPVNSIYNAMQGLYTFLATANKRIDQGMPQGAVNYEQISPEYKGGIWAPYGELLSVIAPGNHPLSNQGWLEALSYGYRIMLRPSQRDPLTAYRLILALKKAGLSEGMAAYVPCDHRQVDNIISAGDLSLVYGGESMVERYQSNANVILRGPGYSKILFESETFCLSDSMQKQVTESILDDGGVKCTNVSGLLVQGSITPVLSIIKQRLSGIKAAPLYSKDAVLPVMTFNTASSYYNHIKKIMC
ncbi:aldehyde dehydrogenase family protein [Dickeya sp. DW 0440]|uniref:aldehyde dehydrogenase family protein n=1 Tax=Dickeya sp. DW 0440 TaxID=1225785 RepID=UPI0003A90555|nr:aldehyde dehydrogenase family protein [Dickeya sp. DW 0440]